MPTVNEKWAARILGMDWQPVGIDLTGDRCVVEVKFSLLGNGYSSTWTVLEYQMSYRKEHSGKRAYWGLGTYRLSKDVDKIRTRKEEELEKLVTERELWIVAWRWMNQFPPSETSGKTRLSEWQNTLRYPKKKFLPPAVKTYEVERGKIYLTERVDENDFPFLSF